MAAAAIKTKHIADICECQKTQYLPVIQLTTSNSSGLNPSRSNMGLPTYWRQVQR